MLLHPYRILERKRAGLSLTAAEVRAVVEGAVDGSWSDPQLAAFLMAAAIQGLDVEETGVLTRAMLESGEQWDLASQVPGIVDKHSTGGVGDKVSLVLAPLLAARGIPVAMLTGRGLGHSGGTADKLESIPGVRLEIDRERCLALVEETRMAVGIATGSIAPADRRLYELRDATATVNSIPLVTGSILSKKLATGAAAIVFDVKTGDGAFFPRLQDAHQLARQLVETSTALGRPARALVTDMSQPLGRWVGHTAEVREALECLSGEGPAALTEVVLALCQEVSDLAGQPERRENLEAALGDGTARACFERWAAAQGASRQWLDSPRFPLAPVEEVLQAPRTGVLARVYTKQLGLLLAEAGGGRGGAESIDHGVSLKYTARLGDTLEAGGELGRLYLRRPDPELVERFAACFEVAEDAEVPDLIHRRVLPRA